MDTSLISTLVIGLLSLLLTVGVKYALSWMLRNLGVLKQKISPSDWAFLVSVVKAGVQFAEQTGLDHTGKQKFEQAMLFVQDALKNTAFKDVDFVLLTGLIESAVHELYSAAYGTIEATPILVAPSSPATPG